MTLHPVSTAWSFHRPAVDRGRRGIRRQEGDRFPGFINRLDLLADIGRGADIHAQPVIGANELRYRLAIVVRALGHDELRRLVRMRRGPLTGFLVSGIEFWDQRPVLL